MNTVYGVIESHKLGSDHTYIEILFYPEYGIHTPSNAMFLHLSVEKSCGNKKLSDKNRVWKVVYDCNYKIIEMKSSGFAYYCIVM